jgi:quercetin dioxygenase-like cupin family protein
MEPMSDERASPPKAAERVIHNPISGEQIVIRTSAAETGGRLLVFDLSLPPGGHVPARHAHPIQEERFTVMQGRMRFRFAGNTILVNPGEIVVVSPTVQVMNSTCQPSWALGIR